MTVVLDARLQAVADLVPSGLRVADIGTDHGYLPVYLVASGKCPSAIAGDKSAQSCAKAETTVLHYGCAPYIQTRVGDGLQIVAAGEVDVVVMAGMGGWLMIDILEAAPQVLSSVQSLVLQPQKNSEQLRRWLETHSWRIVDERMVYDSGFYYVVIAAEPGQMQLSEDEAEFGPCILRSCPEVFRDYLHFRLRGIQMLHASLADKQGQEVGSRLVQLKKQEEKIQFLLEGMSKTG